MKIVIAPDSFKESLSAAEVARALAEGVLLARPDARIDLCPMADGGEGTVEAMIAATSGKIIAADVFGPLGSPVRARFGMLGTGCTGYKPVPPKAGGSTGFQPVEGTGCKSAPLVAVIEMSAASGLALVPPELRDPLRTTTFGTGQLVLAALDAGASEIILGIGGSATVDGGCGCAQALGVTFTKRSGEPCVCGLAGGGLGEIADIDLSDRDPRIASARIRVACDVTNPLTGPDGAAGVYAPQKGATAEVVEQLEANLKHLADVIRRRLHVEVEKMPGAGAAGGLGAGLVAFVGATLERGVELVAEAVGLERRLAGADLCITGEGKLDASSRFGKTAVGVADLACRTGVPCICIPAQADTDAPRELFESVCPLVADDVTVENALARPAFHLKRRAAEALHAFRQ